VARRKIAEEHVNHERWLVSYADFITLLFAFFVVMYSISQVNESKYRVLSNTLNAAFNQPEISVQPVQIGEQAKSNPVNLIQLDAMAIKDKEGQAGGEQEGEMPEEFKQLSDQIEQALKGLIAQKLVTLRGNELWLEIELSSSLLFDSGDAALRSNKALELLGQIAAILKTQQNPVRVEGFTDDKPIHTARYPSNWELSSARAASVVQFFMEEGLDPNRMVAVGYGEFQPIADNATPEGRGRNRRVVLMISKTGELRPKLKPIEPTEVTAPPPAEITAPQTPTTPQSSPTPQSSTAAPSPQAPAAATEPGIPAALLISPPKAAPVAPGAAAPKVMPATPSSPADAASEEPSDAYAPLPQEPIAPAPVPSIAPPVPPAPAADAKATKTP
jgi:chemotaxis protein MotB